MFDSFFINIFNSNAKKANPDLIIRNLHIKPGMRIADVGSGGGYFVGRFSKKVGLKGVIYAVDINKNFLDHIDKLELDNVITQNTTKLKIPKNSLDIIFTRNAYHHLTNRVKYFSNLKKYLKKTGTLVIIDYKPRPGISFYNLFGHQTLTGEIISEMKKAGFKLDRVHDCLKDQSFLIFKKSK